MRRLLTPSLEKLAEKGVDVSLAARMVLEAGPETEIVVIRSIIRCWFYLMSRFDVSNALKSTSTLVEC